DTSRQTKNLNKLLIRILLHLQVEFSKNKKRVGETSFSLYRRKDHRFLCKFVTVNNKVENRV
ncbi:hypothetical protein, partial [Phocaeicola vulgatus]|uniref:hypothetical protein n=1 Tax=Phocaeicola vulgatus TaxID=821 RepID=UPI0035680039